MAMMSSFAEAGDVTDEGVWRAGVPGSEGYAGLAEMGRVGSEVGGAMGRVIERRFVFLEAEDVEREERVTASSAGVGGGGICSAASSIGGQEGITAMLCRFLRVLRLLVLVIVSFSKGQATLEIESEPS